MVTDSAFVTFSSRFCEICSVVPVHKALSETQGFVLCAVVAKVASVSHLCSVEMVFRNELFRTFLWGTMEDVRIHFSSTVYLTGFVFKYFLSAETLSIWKHY